MLTSITQHLEVEIEKKQKSSSGKKFNLVILIDDDKDDNYLHCEIIKKTGLAKRIECFTHALDAISYFKNCLTERPLKKYRVPDLVLLDFMMPFYNGIELVEEFIKLPDPYDRKKKIKWVMLSNLEIEVLEAHVLLTKKHYKQFIREYGRKPLQAELLFKLAE